MGRTVFDSPSPTLQRCSGCEKLHDVERPFDRPTNWTGVSIAQTHEEHGVVGEKGARLMFCEDCTPHFDIAMLTLKDSLKPELEVDLTQ
jgi:hypothetical protein